MRTYKMKCGCVAEYERERWHALCPAHEAEFQEIHQRWAREHAEKKLLQSESKPGTMAPVR